MKQSLPWSGIISDETIELYEEAGFANKVEIGKRPCLMVIDAQYATTGEQPMPLPDALAYHPMNCGEHAWRAIPNMQRLLAMFREGGFPVVYTKVIARKSRAPNRRMPMAANFDPRHWEIVEALLPREGEGVFEKDGPSAFSRADVGDWVRQSGADTLVVTGNTTSGCVRATVIDAYSEHYQILVPHDAVYDRSPVSHAVNLFDINAKYGQVLSTDDALRQLERIG